MHKWISKKVGICSTAAMDAHSALFANRFITTTTVFEQRFHYVDLVVKITVAILGKPVNVLFFFFCWIPVHYYLRNADGNQWHRAVGGNCLPRTPTGVTGTHVFFVFLIEFQIKCVIGLIYLEFHVYVISPTTSEYVTVIVPQSFILGIPQLFQDLGESLWHCLCEQWISAVFNSNKYIPKILRTNRRTWDRVVRTEANEVS